MRKFNSNKIAKKILIHILPILLTQCFPQECPECEEEKKVKYEYQIIGASQQPALNSNFVEEISFDSQNNRLLISTQAGGFSILDSNSNFTTFDDTILSSNNINSTAGQDKIMTAVAGNDGKSYIDYYDGTNWTKNFQASLSTANYSKVIYNGSSFFILEDKTTDGFLSSVAPATTVQSTIHLISDFTKSLGTTPNISRDTDDTVTNTTVSMTGQAISDIGIDKDSDVIAYGSSWLNGSKINLVLFRYKRSDLTNKMGSSIINPISFGQPWETPTSMAYQDRSVGAFVIEYFYFATTQGLYRVELNSYTTLFEIKRFYFNGTNWTLGNESGSVIIRDMKVINNALWMATNKGISIFRSDFETLNVSNSSLPSNNIYSVNSFNGFVYAATDAGLVKIKEIAVE